MTISLSTAARNAKADALIAQIGSGAFVRFYDGTPPASANAALSGNTLLAELTAGSPFAPAASGGALTANAVTQDSSANASGTTTFARIYKADGVTCVVQGSVGTSGADFNINTTAIVVGGPVALTTLVWTEGNP